MGGWWDRKGENEIDLVCEEDGADVLDLYEVKRDVRRIDVHALERKAEALLAKHPEKRHLRLSCKGLSLADM